MKKKPTHDDANLILRLFELRREDKLRAARKWMGAIPPLASRDQFTALCPPGSEENAYFRMVASYWDMAAALVTSGVLHRELFYQANNLELLLVWEKIKGATLEIRRVNNDPLRYRHLEEVAKGFIKFLNHKAPGFYDTFAGNIARSGRAPAPKSS